MRKYLTKIITNLSLSVLLVGMVSPAVLAATAPTAVPAAATTPAGSGQALEIAPPLIYLNVNPGQTVSTQILIRDVSNTALLVTGQANDFVASGDGGTPKVILNSTTVDPYSLKSWVVPPASLDLIPKQIKTLNVTINVPANASPGGHYGVIRFTASAPALNGQTSGVSLSASIGSLLLLTVSGNITHQLSVTSFTTSHNNKSGSLFQSGPVAFTELIKNTGNVHEQPAGLVTIKDMFGRKVATLPVNQASGNILPDSSRQFSQAMNKSVIGNKRLFGRYSANLALTYDSGKKSLNTSLSFWVIPFKTVAIVIIVLIALFFAARTGLRRYNRRILEEAQKPRHDDTKQ